MSFLAFTLAGMWKKIPASNLTEPRTGCTIRLDDDEPEKVLGSAVLRPDGSGRIDVTFADGSTDVADSLTYIDIWS